MWAPQGASGEPARRLLSILLSSFRQNKRPPSRPLGAPRESQERFLSVNRCPSQDETTSGGNDSEAARALLDAGYLSTVWEDRQGCLGRKPSAGHKAGFFRLSPWPRRRQGREPDGVLRCLQHARRSLETAQGQGPPPLPT